MSKVVSLHGGPVAPMDPLEPDEEVIAVLEDLLERAKMGEISSIAYAYLLPEHAIGTGWAGADYGGEGIALGFAVSALHHGYYDGIRNG